MGTAIRLRLFWGAYAPLFALLALRFDPTWLRITCGVMAVLGVASLLELAVWAPRRIAPDVVRVNEVRDEGNTVSGFLASYLLPFLTVSEPGGYDLAAYSLFLVIAALVYVRSEMTQINPTLYLFGYRIVMIRTTGQFSGYAVIKKALHVGDDLRKVTLSNDVVVEAGRRGNGGEVAV